MSLTGSLAKHAGWKVLARMFAKVRGRYMSRDLQLCQACELEGVLIN